MSIAKRMGRSTTVLGLGLSLSLAACQSSAVSSLAPSEANPSKIVANITEDAIAEPSAPALRQPALNPAGGVNGDSNGNDSAVTTLDTPQSQPIYKADAESDSSALGLANHLTEIGAQMFGAYWCPHCQEQKKKFGEAFSAVDYVECDPGGENPQTQLCLDSNIEAFPTWVINDEHHLGVHSLVELAELSGYEGEI